MLCTDDTITRKFKIVSKMKTMKVLVRQTITGKSLRSFLSKLTFIRERFDYYAQFFLVCSPESFLVLWVHGGRWWDLILNKKVLLHH